MLNDRREMTAMKSRLEEILSRGIKLYLDGQPASPAGIVDRFVREDAVYMPDFVINEEGVLTQVRYDKVEDH